jgi:glutamate synthase domain-containing protein 3
MIIDAGGLDFKALNEAIRASGEKELVLTNVGGQRYIGCGTRGLRIEIRGTPGNALGAFLDGSSIEVRGNAQDAAGDTMNAGRIVVHGSSGDTTGYGMRGGEIFVRDDAGYRMGIHMKEYMDARPVIVVGGSTGDFTGEYQAGGIIIVLGTGRDGAPPVGKFCGTGMHGGVMFLRAASPPSGLPAQVNVSDPDEADRELLRKYVAEYCGSFGRDRKDYEDLPFIKLTANTKNPYRQLYTIN